MVGKFPPVGAAGKVAGVLILEGSPADQLAALNQSVSIAPVQVVCADKLVVQSNRPIQSKDNSLMGICFALKKNSIVFVQLHKVCNCRKCSRQGKTNLRRSISGNFL